MSLRTTILRESAVRPLRPRAITEAADGDPHILHFVDALVCQSAGVTLRESNYLTLMEKWSDAARAAAAAARKAKGGGKDWKQAARKAYFGRAADQVDAGTHKAVIKQLSPKVWGAAARGDGGDWQARGAGRTPGEAQQAARDFAADRANSWRKNGLAAHTSRGIARDYIAAGKTLSSAKKVKDGGARGTGPGLSRAKQRVAKRDAQKALGKNLRAFHGI